MQDNQLVIYQIENGEIRIEVQVYNESVWLSLNQMANIFERDKSVISRHLKNIFQTEELDRHSTVAKFAIVQQEGEREIKRGVEYYNLDAILSVGYRVNSKRGIQFRQWASKILKDYLIQGYSVNKDKVIQDRLYQLRQTVELLSATLINQNLINDVGIELVSLIKTYTKTWDMLIRYDEGNLNIPTSLREATDGLLDYREAINAIAVLRNELKQEIGNLFGLERDDALKGFG